MGPSSWSDSIGWKGMLGAMSQGRLGLWRNLPTDIGGTHDIADLTSRP
jgi:hypothetical protein